MYIPCTYGGAFLDLLLARAEVHWDTRALVLLPRRRHFGADFVDLVLHSGDVAFERVQRDISVAALATVCVPWKQRLEGAVAKVRSNEANVRQHEANERQTEVKSHLSASTSAC